MSSKTILQLQDLVIGYTGKTVLNGITFAVESGEILTIVGRSGCGKSTLLKTIIGLLPAQGGSMRFHEGELVALSEDKRREFYRHIGVLYQNSALLNSLNVFENVALPLHIHYPGLAEEIVRAMVQIRLGQVDLAGSESRLPGELSGGMLKRVALARALILDPQIVFCDEPAAGLDPQTAAGLSDLILGLQRLLKATFVVVTHDREAVEALADRVVLVGEGRMLYCGKPDFNASGSLLTEFFREGQI
jgi:phospholipid/cholesterol/gamma-HCH transport system ATP-binding protein